MHVFLIVLVVAVGPIDLEAGRRGRGEEHVVLSRGRNGEVDLLFERGLPDVTDRPGAGLNRALLRHLRARCIEQRAALAGVFVEVSELFPILALFDQWLAFGQVDVGETAKPGLHVAQPVAAFGELAFVDDVDAGLSLACDDCGDVVGKMRLVTDRQPFVRRQEGEAADVSRQYLRYATLHLIYSAARNPSPRRPSRTSLPGSAPVCTPRS